MFGSNLLNWYGTIYILEKINLNKKNITKFAVWRAFANKYFFVKSKYRQAKTLLKYIIKSQN